MGRAQPACIAQGQVVCLLDGPTLAIVDDECFIGDFRVRSVLFDEVEGVEVVFLEAPVECNRGRDDSTQGASIFWEAPSGIEVG